MPKRDEIYHVAAEWVQKAENDLTNPSNTLRLGGDFCFISCQKRLRLA